jgi:hypothetical protein
MSPIRIKIRESRAAPGPNEAAREIEAEYSSEYFDQAQFGDVLQKLNYEIEGKFAEWEKEMRVRFEFDSHRNALRELVNAVCAEGWMEPMGARVDMAAAVLPESEMEQFRQHIEVAKEIHKALQEMQKRGGRTIGHGHFGDFGIHSE